jgi:hypothetical protein
VAVVGYGLWVSGERVSKRRSDFFLVFRWAEARREERRQARGKREAVLEAQAVFRRCSGGRRIVESGSEARKRREERGHGECIVLSMSIVQLQTRGCMDGWM